MTAWQLAEVLIKGKDFPVVVDTVKGLEEVEKIEEEDKNHIVLGRSYEGFPLLEDDRLYGIFEEKNDEPKIVLITQSFGLE